MKWCDFVDDGHGRCFCLLCDPGKKRTQKRPSKRKCGDLLVIVNQPPPCPFAPIVQRLTLDGLTRLGRCREANCGMMHKHGGNMVCVGRGKSCEWLGLWAAWLNSGRECPHWKEAI